MFDENVDYSPEDQYGDEDLRKGVRRAYTAMDVLALEAT